MSIEIRSPVVRDGVALWSLVRDVGLDLNSPYAYLMWADYFARSSVVAAADDQVVGCLMGFIPPEDPSAVFVWQVGVATHARGRGVGGRMVDALLDRTAARWLEATVTPTNTPSAALFAGTARRHGVDLTVSEAYPSALFPGAHEPEERVRLGPFVRTTDIARDPRT